MINGIRVPSPGANGRNGNRIMLDKGPTGHSTSRRSGRRRLQIGLLRLADIAPLVVAKELGFFAAEGIDATLSVEPSWANIADKLTYGLLDGAVMLPPLAFAVNLGVRGTARPLVVPMSLSIGGNTVTLATGLAQSLSQNAASGDALATARTLAAHIARRREHETPVLAVVHAYSTHNLLLRYWLAAGGIDPDRDVKWMVVPPARVVDALRERQITGFCAGAPWGEVAARAGLGVTVATSRSIWSNGPEKVLAVSQSWAEKEPDALQALLRAALRAAQFCDCPENALRVAAILSDDRYLDMDADIILTSLPGGARDVRKWPPSADASTFFANAATFPWRSQALWFLREMARWRYLGPDVDLPAAAAAVYRPDLYARAAAAVGASVPLIDSKPEGSHGAAWMLEARPSPIAMGPDLFCDGAVFDPTTIRGATTPHAAF
jgi:two-component system, oxyanion-binding sensor